MQDQKFEVVMPTPFGTYLLHVLPSKAEADDVSSRYETRPTKVRPHSCSSWAVKQCSCK